MSLGISFGTKKAKTVQDTTVDKTEVGTQTGSSTQTNRGTTTNTGSTTGSTTQSGTSSTTGTGASTTTGTGSQQSAQTQELFSAPVLTGLESAVQGAFGSINGRTPVDMSGLDSFDPRAFVEGGMAQAQATQQMQLDESLNTAFSAIGGSDSTNSMAALLANRTRGDAAANLAGVRSQLEGNAAGIVRDNIATRLSGQGQENQFVNDLLASLRGGRSTTTGTQTQQTSEASQQQQSQNASQSQSGTSSEQTQSQQMQDLIQILAQAMSTNMHTTGTESTRGTQSQSGGGIGISM